jgi:hypothetical protein
MIRKSILHRLFWNLHFETSKQVLLTLVKTSSWRFIAKFIAKFENMLSLL